MCIPLKCSRMEDLVERPSQRVRCEQWSVWSRRLIERCFKLKRFEGVHNSLWQLNKSFFVTFLLRSAPSERDELRHLPPSLLWPSETASTIRRRHEFSIKNHWWSTTPIYSSIGVRDDIEQTEEDEQAWMKIACLTTVQSGSLTLNFPSSCSLSEETQWIANEVALIWPSVRGRQTLLRPPRTFSKICSLDWYSFKQYENLFNTFTWHRRVVFNDWMRHKQVIQPFGPTANNCWACSPLFSWFPN